MICAGDIDNPLYMYLIIYLQPQEGNYLSLGMGDLMLFGKTNKCIKLLIQGFSNDNNNVTLDNICQV